VFRRSVVAALVAFVFLAGCASLPPLEGRVETKAFTDTGDTILGRAVTQVAAAHPGKSGIYPVPDPRDALAARLLLAAAAQRSIDAQYFVWHADQAGYLLLEALWQAAERGVRVRLLLDDMYTRGLDATLAAFGTNPNVEVRLYNPFPRRSARALDFVTDFERVNRRMHNKSFTVDNQVAIVGGRNIGNEYFAAGTGVAFTDLDVIAIGTVVPDISNEFDRYWNSASAYPAGSIVGPPAPSAVEELKRQFSSADADAESVQYLDAVRSTPMVRNLVDRTLDLEWTTARLLYDDPAKTLDVTGRTDVLLLPELLQTMRRPEATLDLVSPYFVPGEGGAAALAAAAERGVKVRVVTNSLSSTDVPAVHAGYAKRRRTLLRAGVHLYELKATQARVPHGDSSEVGSTGSAALHAKTFAVDRTRIFVGSFNLDPRSAQLNTEMGLVIESATLARRLGEALDAQAPKRAYEVRLKPDGDTIEWIERTPSGEIRYDTEPKTTLSERFKVELLSLLPIEPLL